MFVELTRVGFTWESREKTKKKAEYEETKRLPKYAIISGLRSLPTEARFKRRATAVPNSNHKLQMR